MYIITCERDDKELKLVKDEDIKYNWGENIFDAVIFNTREEAIDFIKNEPMFSKIINNRKPFLLSDININSVYITKIEEIKYKRSANIKFDKLLRQIKSE